MKRRAEQMLLMLMIAIGMGVAIYDLVSLLMGVPAQPTGTAPSNSGVPSITLFILSTITLFLVLELDKLTLLEGVHANLDRIFAQVDIEELRSRLLNTNYGGIEQVYPSLPIEEYLRWLHNTRRDEIVRTLLTWIPDMGNGFEEAITVAVQNGATVEILLLHPSSPVAALRGASLDIDARTLIIKNLLQLSDIYMTLPEESRSRLKVRLYNSPLSVAMHQVGNRYLVTMYFQKNLAVHSPHLVIAGSDSTLGQALDREFRLLWTADETSRVDLRPPNVLTDTDTFPGGNCRQDDEHDPNNLELG